MFHITLTKAQYEYVRALLDNDRFELKVADAAAKEFLNSNDGVSLYTKTKNNFVFAEYKEE
jgi:hypothetical protein